jgi:hypothetical protein
MVNGNRLAVKILCYDIDRNIGNIYPPRFLRVFDIADITSDWDRFLCKSSE